MNDLQKDNVVSFLTLRQTIGWVALVMPIAVRVGAFHFDQVSATGSISAYYYTGMRDVFVSTLVLVGALLTCYRTPAWFDNAIGIVCGLCAIGLGLFPMDAVAAEASMKSSAGALALTIDTGRGFPGWYHEAFTTTFFALGFWLVYFRFRAFTPAIPTPQKIVRNRIYQICGLVMLASFIGIYYLRATHSDRSIFWPETVAVVAFAVAWLVKGQTILKDSVGTSAAAARS